MGSKPQGAGKVVQSVKHLLYKYTDLSSDPHNPYKKQSTANSLDLLES